MAKDLVVYYSRSGTTRKVARQIAELLQADVEEIADTKDRKGLTGWLGSARDALLRRSADIEPAENDPADYDMVLIGTPVWGGTVSSPVRAYLEQQAGRLPEVAFFLTTGGSGVQRTFEKMAELAGQKPVAALGLRARDVHKGRHRGDVLKFIERLER